MAKIEDRYTKPSVADWIVAAINHRKSVNFWVSTNALWVDQDGEVLLNRNAEGRPNRNSFDATVLVNLSITTTKTGVVMTRVVVDIRHSYGKWIKQRAEPGNWDIVIDELVQ